MVRLSRRQALFAAAAAAAGPWGAFPGRAPAQTVALTDAFSELCISADGGTVATVPLLDSFAEILIVDADLQRSEIWTCPGPPALLHGLRLDGAGRRLIFCTDPIALGVPPELMLLDRQTGLLTRLDTGLFFLTAPILDEESGQVFFFASELDVPGLRAWAMPLEGGPPRRLDDQPLQMVTRSVLWRGRLLCDGAPGADPFEAGRSDNRTGYRRLNVVGGADADLEAKLVDIGARYGSVSPADVLPNGTLLATAIDLDNQRRRVLSIGDEVKVLGAYEPTAFVRVASARDVDRLVWSRLIGDGDFDVAKHLNVGDRTESVLALAARAERRVMIPAGDRSLS